MLITGVLDKVLYILVYHKMQDASRENKTWNMGLLCKGQGSRMKYEVSDMEVWYKVLKADM